MRVHFAIIFSLICGPALAGDASPAFSTNAITVAPAPPPPAAVTTPITTPVSVGRPHRCDSAYPLEALEQMAEGKALLSFRIGTDGHVKGAALEQSSGNNILDTASIACASTWTYKPATNNGTPVEVPWKANIIWTVGPPSPPVQPATPCRRFVAANYKLPDGASGRSLVVLLVMPDGSIVPKKIVGSSGDVVLDTAAMQCVAARIYKPANGVVLPDGRALYTVVDWREELTPPK